MPKPEKKKSIYAWLILGIIVFCLIIVSIILQGANNNEQNAISSTSNQQNEINTDTVDQSKLTLVDASVKPHIAGSGTWEIVGNIKNNDDSLYYTASFEVSVYGKDGDWISAAVGNVDRVGPGETQSFSAFANNNISDFKDFKIHINTLLPYE